MVVRVDRILTSITDTSDLLPELNLGEFLG
jgi:hypothetical protein